MANLCQTDYEIVRPNEYFPETFRDGKCDACGEQTFVARASKAEVEMIRTPPAEHGDECIWDCPFEASGEKCRIMHSCDRCSWEIRHEQGVDAVG
jgi:hypothetical protein